MNYYQTSRYIDLPLFVFNLIVFMRNRYGRSLGCVPASYLASRNCSLAGVILESPVPRISKAAGILSSLFPKKQCKELKRLDCVNYLRCVTCPKLLIYGSLDHFNRKASQKVVNRKTLFMQELLQYFTENDMVLCLEKFGHNNIPFGSNQGRVCVFGIQHSSVELEHQALESVA